MEPHISDQELLLDVDGEAAAGRASAIKDHLTGCWLCRARRAELEQTIAEFVQVKYRPLDAQVPSGEAAKALLQARLATAASVSAGAPFQWAWAAAVVVLAGLGCLMAWLPMRSTPVQVAREFAPNGVLTPGAVRLVSRETVCAAVVEPKVISIGMAQAVFAQYGIHDPEPRSYEVDYLIPPSLGGSEEVSNLWPQPYSTGIWTARVKDALEDRLRSMVCDGSLDLGTVQREMALDWISAYKKYFKTESPLLDHVAFIKDRPWE